MVLDVPLAHAFPDYVVGDRGTHPLPGQAMTTAAPPNAAELYMAGRPTISPPSSPTARGRYILGALPVIEVPDAYRALQPDGTLKKIRFMPGCFDVALAWAAEKGVDVAFCIDHRADDPIAGTADASFKIWTTSDGVAFQIDTTTFRGKAAAIALDQLPHHRELSLGVRVLESAERTYSGGVYVEVAHAMIRELSAVREATFPRSFIAMP